MALVSAAFLASPVLAQETGGTDQSAQAPNAIVVTARRREETLQDIPVAINVVSQETIERKGVRDMASVAAMTPGLQFDTGASPADVRPSLRGVALIEGRSNVAMIVDGIDSTGVSLNTVVGGGGNQNATALMDIARIEVVKGPQTVYFGRSAFAGAISFVSKDPEFKLGGSVNLAMGAYGQQEATAHITGPLIGDTVAAKISATYRDFGGFYTNPGNGLGLDASRTYGVGGTVLIKSGAFTGKIRASYLNNNAGPGAGYVMPRKDTSLYGVNTITEADFDKSQVAISSDHRYAGNDSDTYRGVLDLEYDLGNGFVLNSLSGYNRTKGRLEFDFDKEPQSVPSGVSLGNGLVNCLSMVCVGIFDFDNDLQQISSDLRLSYDAGPLRAMVGGYVFDENYTEVDYSRFVGANTFITSTRENIPGRVNKLDTNTYSGFGSLEYDLTDAVTVTGELRYNHEVISAAATTGVNLLFLTGTNAIDFRGTATFDAWLPRVSAAWKLSPDLNVYASLAKGSKPGGFNTGQVRDDLRPFGQETIWTYELGTKGSLLNGDLSFEADVYYSDWRNLQVTTVCYGTLSAYGPEAECPTSSAVSINYIINARKAEVKGFEFGASARPFEWLTLNGNYAYTDSTFKDFEARDVYPAPSGTDRQFGGNRVPLVPRHSATFTAHVEAPLTDSLDGFVEGTGNYRSSRYSRFDNRVKLDQKFTADAQIGLKGGSWTALAFVNNIFNDLTPDFSRFWGSFNPSGSNGEYITAPAKRTGGVRFIKNF
ncbi:TonB-dependent receptor [Novosphingobium profundi]|uniref:TonB-dependent receptor n=1 Tax=Novosphingobium profundi TaxID=1774954 RepID=UPI001BDB1266|nr:TonB-dependent receptor [Novosphingobium profundi]MBT0670198.1 TonB-dependent receptor [Novosphingobium profundi]